jgi:glutathione S-transferase
MNGLTFYRAAYSTNCERVGLALAHKGLEAESVFIDYADRSEVERVSGQPLVPVLADGDVVVSDSVRILQHLERRNPDPRLYPAAAEQRAAVEIFIDWFERVWKAPPNELEAELADPEPDPNRIEALAALVQERLFLFNDLLLGRDFLGGAALSAADCVAYPFLKYALGREDGDDEPFHRVLDEYQTLGSEHAELAAWIERVGALPRA